MIELYDMHSHILPNVDDGSRNMEMTIEMLRIAYSQGIRNMVATPHYTPGADNCPVAELKERLQEVQEEALKIGDDFHIYLGNELYYSEGIWDRLDQKEALTLNDSRYVLVEFDITEKYKVIYDALKECIRRGYFPVIAHIERYLALFMDFDKVEELMNLGAYVQVNISSLEGGLTDRTASFCRKLLKYNMIHIFGTDAHRAAGRAPTPKKGAAYIEKKYGAGTVKLLMHTNPKKMLNNKIL